MRRHRERAALSAVLLLGMLTLCCPPSTTAQTLGPSTDYADSEMSQAPSSVSSSMLLSNGAPSTTVRVSISTEGAQANGACKSPSISDDGRYVVFVSYADNLVPGDTNEKADVFCHDLHSGVTTRVSLASDGTQANADCMNPSVSQDGDYVVFESQATTLVAGASPGAEQVYRHRRSTGQTILVSVGITGTAGNYGSRLPDISASGQYVAFESTARNLVISDTNSADDVFVRDMSAGATVRVSAPEMGEANGSSRWPSISADGSRVSFLSDATNLVLTDTLGHTDVFVRDRTGGPVTRISEGLGEANNVSYNPSMSSDGQVIAFSSLASNLVLTDTNGCTDVFVRDLGAGTLTRISVSDSGVQGDGISARPSLSSDGTYVAFGSFAKNLVADDDNSRPDVFLYYVTGDELTRVSVNNAGAQAEGGDSGLWDGLSLSNNNKIVAFASSASNLVDGDSNGVSDIFVHVRGNYPPVAEDDSATTPEETPISIDVKLNDHDDDDPTLTLTAVTQPAHGATSIYNQRVTYTPTLDYEGLDTFQYTITDGSLRDTATVTVTVTNVNDAPVAADDSALAASGVPVVIRVLDNDTDVDPGDVLSIADVEDLDPADGVAATDGTTVSYTPPPLFAGIVFTYTVSDGELTDVGTVTVGLNLPPTAYDDKVATDEDTPLTIAPLTNDDSDDALAVGAVTQPARGEATIVSATEVRYTPTLDYNGQDTFTYTCRDTSLQTDTARITITVSSENDPPTAVDDEATTSEDAPVTVDVLANDNDIEDSVAALSVAAVAAPSHGLVAIVANAVVYTPALNYNGPDVFRYVMSDLGGLTATATVSVTVLPVPDPPEAVDDQASTQEDVPVDIDVLDNDREHDGEPLELVVVGSPASGTASIVAEVVRYTPTLDFCGADVFTYTIGDGTGLYDEARVTVTVACLNDPPVSVDDEAWTAEDTPVAIAVLDSDSDPDPGDALHLVAVGEALSGTTTISGTVVVYAPLLDLYGTDTFTYTVADGPGLTDWAWVTVHITPVNDAPRPVDDVALVNQGEAVTIDVLANDSDPEDDPLTLDDPGAPTQGAASVVANGLVFTPTAGWSGLDVWRYTVADSHGLTATATITVTVNGPPVAVDDPDATTDEDAALSIPVLDNDIDDPPLFIDAVGLALSGTAVISGTVVVYTPDADIYGSDTFTYTCVDLGGLSDTARVTVTIAPVEDAPRPRDDDVATWEETPVTVYVLENDEEPDGDALSLVSVGPALHGGATISGTAMVYTPTLNWDTTDTVPYTVRDTGGLTATAQVHVVITGTPDAPIALDDHGGPASVEFPVAITVLANDYDPDTGQTLDLEVVDVGTPLSGTATIRGDYAVVYTPSLSIDGVDVFTYTIEDPDGLTAWATIYVTITEEVNPPVAVDDHVETPEDTPVAIDVRANDSDPDPGDTLTIVEPLGAPLHGSVVLSGTLVVYTPDQDYYGLDSFGYTIRDQGGRTASATVYVTITAVNDPPVAVDDSANPGEDTSVAIPVLDNDSDPDGDTLFILSVTSPANGEALVVGDIISYTPALDYHGPDAFDYVVTDGALTDTARVDIVVAATGDPPVAVDDTLEVPACGWASVDVLDNDSDPDGDPLTVVAVGPAAMGLTSTDGTRATYTALPWATGVDVFTYTVSDGLLIDTAQVHVAIIGDPSVLVVEPTWIGLGVGEGGPDPDPRAVSVTHSLCGPLPWTGHVEDESPPTGWLSVEPLSGDTPGSAQVRVSVAGLSAGFYTGQVVIANAGMPGDEQRVTVDLTISQSPPPGEHCYLPWAQQSLGPHSVLWGLVLTELGLPVPDAVVSLRDGPATVTNVNGFYIFYEVPNGLAQINVAKDGWRFWPSPATVAVLGTTVQDFLGIPDYPFTATPTHTPGPSATPSATQSATRTATGTVSPTPTATPTATPVSHGMVNGGFETDDGWVIVADARPAAYSSTQARAGARAMLLGIPDPGANAVSESAIEQTTFVPEGTSAALLRFWLYPLLDGSTSMPRAGANVAALAAGTDVDAPRLLSPHLAPPGHEDMRLVSAAGDVQYVEVRDTLGSSLTTLVWQRGDARAWGEYAFDLAPLCGQPIVVRFGVVNDGSDGVAAMYVDEVSLELYASAARAGRGTWSLPRRP